MEFQSGEVFPTTAIDCPVVQLLVSTPPGAPPEDSAGGAREGVTGVTGFGASPGTEPGGGVATASIEMVDLL